MQNLTPTEEKLLALLKNKSGHSIWHIAIHNTIKTGSAKSLRNLFQQLKSEGEQVPEMMQKIIGADAWRLLSALQLASFKKFIEI